LEVAHYLILSDLSTNTEIGGRGRSTFIFSSPNPARYKEMTKNDPSYKFYMPTWSDWELKLVRPDVEHWRDRFILFGGVPRLVFWDESSGPEQQLIDRLEDKGSAMAVYFFECGFGDVDDAKSYMLVHVNPPWITLENRYRYDLHVWSFASDEIFKRIGDKYIKRTISGAINILNAGVASEVLGGGSAGHLFEKICLWLVPIAGKTLTICSLEKGMSYSIALPASTTLLEYHWEKQTLLTNTLYQPKISNLESGDAFCVIECKGDDGIMVLALLVFQFTVGEHHPIKVNGLVKILKAFKNLVIAKKLFIFVTPDVGKLKDVQRFHTKENLVAQKIPEGVRSFEQFLCKYSIS
jgi:hypothetical protein